MQGIVLGYNPRKIAPMIRDALGIQLNRALTISRTEAMRAQRAAATESFKVNADVLKGWRWQVAMSGNTCPVCISMHGSIHPVEERMESHPNCRCSPVPLTKSWEELGAELGVDFSGVEKAGPTLEEIAKKYNLIPEQKRSYARQNITGEAYFRSLSAEEQCKVLGSSKWLAWKEGKFESAQLAKKTYSPVWEAGRGAKNLNELLREQDAEKYKRLAQWNHSENWKKVDQMTAADLLPKAVVSSDTEISASFPFRTYDSNKKIIEGLIPFGSAIIDVRVIGGNGTSTPTKILSSFVDRYGRNENE
ncbi:MAG: phage minor head protein [Anaerolineaceae bacterium]